MRLTVLRDQHSNEVTREREAEIAQQEQVTLIEFKLQTSSLMRSGAFLPTCEDAGGVLNMDSSEFMVGMRVVGVFVCRSASLHDFAYSWHLCTT